MESNVLFEEIIGNFTSLGEAIHAFADFKTYFAFGVDKTLFQSSLLVIRSAVVVKTSPGDDLDVMMVKEEDCVEDKGLKGWLEQDCIGQQSGHWQQQLQCQLMRNV
eukprot:12078663-Ditylum_brightwellii.AAC.1